RPRARERDRLLRRPDPGRRALDPPGNPLRRRLREARRRLALRAAQAPALVRRRRAAEPAAPAARGVAEEPHRPWHAPRGPSELEPVLGSAARELRPLRRRRVGRTRA